MNKYSKCDGRNDCGDNSDEDPKMCGKFVGLPDEGPSFETCMEVLKRGSSALVGG